MGSERCSIGPARSAPDGKPWQRQHAAHPEQPSGFDQFRDGSRSADCALIVQTGMSTSARSGARVDARAALLVNRSALRARAGFQVFVRPLDARLEA